MDKLFEKTIGSTRVYDGKVLHILVDDVELPNGRTSKREIVVHQGGVCVAACACVAKDMPADVLVGGVPAKIIKQLKDHEDVDK